MQLHPLAPVGKRADVRQPSTASVLPRASAVVALACMALTLFGCGGGGSEDLASSEALADEQVAEEPASQPIPEEMADQLIAEELAGLARPTDTEADRLSVSAVAGAQKTGAEWLGASSKSYCLPRITNPIYHWNQLALDAVRAASMSDVQAARVYALVNVAMYDAVNGIEVRRGAQRAQALVSARGAPRDASLNAAASAAARVVLTRLSPDRADVYTAQHLADLAALRHGEAKRDGAAWGVSVGGQVMTLRQNDGSMQSESQAPGSAPGVFRANWTGTQFRNLDAFVIVRPSVYVPSGPPALNSVAYATAFNDVKKAGNGAVVNAASLETFNFWASKPGTSQPAGEWVKVALSLTRKRNLSIQDSARLMALMGVGLADSVAPAMTTKFNFRHWRPVTAIREASASINAATAPDAGWVPRGGLPGGTSPEYISGHSSFAAAGSTILRGFFCDDSIRFSLQTDVPATATTSNPIRTYDTFSEAAIESGRSRILGGLHFEFSNQDGLKLGRGVANEVLDTALLRTQGETHLRSHCPK